MFASRVAVIGLAVCAIASCSSSGNPDGSAPTSTTARVSTSTRSTTTTTSSPGFDTAGIAGQEQLPGGYNQGVAAVPGGWVFSATDSLWRTDEQLNVLVHVSPAIPESWKAKGFDHVGDVDVVGDYVYVPFEQPDYETGQQATARYDRVTLRFVDAVIVPQHHNSFVAVDPATMIAYSTDFFDDGALLRYDVAQAWKPLPPLRMSMRLQRVQGGDIGFGQIFLATDDARHGVYYVDLRTGATKHIIDMGHPGGEGEGIDVSPVGSEHVHVMCVDAKFEPVWFQHIRLGIS